MMHDWVVELVWWALGVEKNGPFCGFGGGSCFYERQFHGLMSASVVILRGESP